MGRLLTEDAWAEQLRDFNSSAFRFEQQPAYAVASEKEELSRFLAGDPQDPTELPEPRAWYSQVTSAVTAGRSIVRVRIHDDPPTPYQRWVRWVGAWNIEAGEVMQYMTRARAHEIGLLPTAGNDDWWLMDARRLIVMRFDEEGQRVASELVTEPAAVRQACVWRDLALQHSTVERAADARSKVH